MKRGRTFRLQCPDVRCCWSVAFATDGKCFCGQRLIMIPNYDELDAIARGERSIEEIDQYIAMLNVEMGHRERR